MRRAGRQTGSAGAWLLLALCLSAAAIGPATGDPVPAIPAEPSPAIPDPAERARREEQLRALEQREQASAEARTRLEREIAGLRADGSRLGAALVASAEAARRAEERARVAEARLDAVLAEEAAIRRSLASRRESLTEVLAALQRMSRVSPPAPLLAAADILSAIRSATLLGGLTPALRDEARRLAADLETLQRLRASIVADRSALAADYAALATERDRVAGLMAARQARLTSAEIDAGRERSRSESLRTETRTIRDLVDRLETEAARERRRVEEAEAGREQARLAQERFAAAAAREPARLSPRTAFAELRGSLPRPVAGVTLREFGEPDGSGGTMRGVALGSRPRAFVTAPADATVVFAGPFRSYGRLLILNAGGGYYILLAGLEAIHVETGQFVLTGEPVARMGENAAPSAALGVVEAGGPVLYVELRKDGGAIDPGPWWAKSQTEKARG